MTTTTTSLVSNSFNSMLEKRKTINANVDKMDRRGILPYVPWIPEGRFYLKSKSPEGGFYLKSLESLKGDFTWRALNPWRGTLLEPVTNWSSRALISEEYPSTIFQNQTTWSNTTHEYLEIIDKNFVLFQIINGFFNDFAVWCNILDRIILPEYQFPIQYRNKKIANYKFMKGKKILVDLFYSISSEPWKPWTFNI